MNPWDTQRESGKRYRQNDDSIGTFAQNVYDALPGNMSTRLASADLVNSHHRTTADLLNSHNTTNLQHHGTTADLLKSHNTTNLQHHRTTHDTMNKIIQNQRDADILRTLTDINASLEHIPSELATTVQHAISDIHAELHGIRQQEKEQVDRVQVKLSDLESTVMHWIEQEKRNQDEIKSFVRQSTWEMGTNIKNHFEGWHGNTP